MNGAHTCHFHMLSMMSKAFFSFSFISLPLSLYIFYTSLILSFLVSSYNPSLPLLSLSWLSSHLFRSLIFLAPSPSFCLSLTPHSCFIILDVGHNFGQLIQDFRSPTQEWLRLQTWSLDMSIPMWLRHEPKGPKLVWMWMWGLGIVNFLGLVLLDQIISFFQYLKGGSH